MQTLRYMAFCAKNAFNKFLKKENGDTNFISIIIILAIVMVVAAIFVGFKEQIVSWVNDTFNTAWGEVSSSGGSGAGGAAGG